jgi:hypothetical protein
MKNLVSISIIILLSLTSAVNPTQFKISYSFLTAIDTSGKTLGTFPLTYTFVFNDNKLKQYSSDGNVENFNIISDASIKYSNGNRFQFFIALDGDGDEVKVSLFDSPQIGLYIGYPQGNILHFHN